MTQLRLISFGLCPYVQRAAILLAEKGVERERVNIDLADRPDWFLELSDGRKEVLLESAVITAA